MIIWLTLLLREIHKTAKKVDKQTFSTWIPQYKNPNEMFRTTAIIKESNTLP